VIKVGIMATLSGPYASSDAQASTVGPAWQKWINAQGGIDGHPVEVLLGDDQANPATAQSIAQKFIADGVAAVIAASDSVTPAWDSAVIAKGIPVIGGTSIATDWWTKAGMFPTGTGITADVGSYVTIGVKYGHAKVYGSVYCAEIPACAATIPQEKAQAKSLGIGFTSLSVSATAPSYVAPCLQLEQAHADFVLLGMAAGSDASMAQACQSQGYNPGYGTSDIAYSPTFLTVPSFTAYGISNAFPLAYTGQPVAAYTAAMKQYAAGDNWQSGDAGETWTGLQAMAKAIEDAKVSATADVTAADVLTGLYSFHGETLGGLVANGLTYPKDKPVGLNFNPCYFVMGVANGKLTAPSGLTPVCPTS
jgi:branched-chain amino acid transport system substrate-binding protein